MKKILHLLNSNSLSGAENVAADICMMFEGDYEMAYCSINGNISDALKDRRVSFIPIEKLSIFELLRVIRSFRPDIIHAHDSRATFFASLVSKKIPIISHLHGNHEDMRHITLKSLLYLLASIKVKKNFIVSESCLNDYFFKKYIIGKTILLKNIIHFKRVEMLVEKDQNNYDFDFVFLGRFSYPKNPKRVASVASKVLKNCPSAKFGIIGDGELKYEMVKVFEDEGVVDRVMFTGKLPYPYKALKTAKCLLMCSRYEGLPIAALEAMALGVPIVSTPVDGLINLVISNESGFLSTNDEELIHFVNLLINDESVYKKLSEYSKKRYKEVCNEIQFQNQLRIEYDTLMNI